MDKIADKADFLRKLLNEVKLPTGFTPGVGGLPSWLRTPPKFGDLMEQYALFNRFKKELIKTTALRSNKAALDINDWLRATLYSGGAYAMLGPVIGTGMGAIQAVKLGAKYSPQFATNLARTLQATGEGLGTAIQRGAQPLGTLGPVTAQTLEEPKALNLESLEPIKR